MNQFFRTFKDLVIQAMMILFLLAMNVLFVSAFQKDFPKLFRLDLDMLQGLVVWGVCGMFFAILYIFLFIRFEFGREQRPDRALHIRIKSSARWQWTYVLRPAIWVIYISLAMFLAGGAGRLIHKQWFSDYW